MTMDERLAAMARERRALKDEIARLRKEHVAPVHEQFVKPSEEQLKELEAEFDALARDKASGQSVMDMDAEAAQ